MITAFLLQKAWLLEKPHDKLQWGENASVMILWSNSETVIGYGVPDALPKQISGW